MSWNIGIEAKDTNLFRLLQQQERAAKKAYLKRIMPIATDSELEAFL